MGETRGRRADARQLAFSILSRVERQGAYSSLLLQRLGDRAPLPPRDHALVTELVYGVLRRRLYLEHVLGIFSDRPLEEIEPDLALVVRLALYQILFLDRIPDHAAVAEAVAMARRRGGGKAAARASFVNGVLRAVTRARTRVPAPESLARNDPDPAAGLALATSHPLWLVRRWMSCLGTESTSGLLASHNRPAPLALRINRTRGTLEQIRSRLAEESVETVPSRFLDEFLRVTSGVPQRTGSFRRGEFYIQDEASGLVARLAGAPPGGRVLDACAAPGGKALALAEGVGERGLVVAADLHPARLRLVRANARRLGVPWCLPVAADLALAAPPLHEEVRFDVVIVDAPCSGTGVIRRDPELRYRLTEESLRRLTELQAALLDRCCELVRPGGVLVYSVCSIEPEEGPGQLERFLAGHDDFTLDDPRSTLPEEAATLVMEDRPGPALMTWPHRDDLDGFFAARMVRR